MAQDTITQQVSWTDEWTVYLSAGSLLATIIIAFIVQRWTFKYWHKQKRHEINYGLEAAKYSAMLEAAKSAWSLLAYVTEKENGKNFLSYKGTKEKPEIYFSIERGKQFLSAISEVFYDNGHGIFLTSEIKNEIFHLRNNVYKIIDAETRKGNLTGEILLENEGLIQFFRNKYESMRIKIKDYLDVGLKYEVAE